MCNNSFNAGCDNLYFAARALWPQRGVLPRMLSNLELKLCMCMCMHVCLALYNIS